MKEIIRLTLVFITGAAIYFIGLYVVPDIGFIKNIIDSTVVDSSNVTQVTFLILSLMLIKRHIYWK